MLICAFLRVGRRGLIKSFMVNIKNNGIDLHLHTTSSDGIYSSSEVVHMASENHLCALAITDHDTIEGIAEAIEAGNTYGIKIISGVEFTTNYEPVVHILGLNLNVNNRELKDHLRHLEQIKLKLLAKALKLVRMDGIKVNAQLIHSKKGTVTILNLKEYLLEHGITQSQDGLDNELQSILDEWRAKTPSVRECINLIHSSGGIAILAHPMLLIKDYRKLKQIIISMKEEGLDGIEVIHPSNTSEEETLLIEWATELELLCSGGSDFHGTHDRTCLASGNGSGDLYIPYLYLKKMMEKRIC